MSEPAAAGETADPNGPDADGGARFWVGVALGWAIMGFGIVGLLRDDGLPEIGRWLTWFVGIAIVHDFVVAPLVAVIATVVLRFAPGGLRAPLQAGLVATAVITAVSWPFVRGYGRLSDNPSASPLNYGRGLLIVLAVVWVAVAATTVVSLRRRPA